MEILTVYVTTFLIVFIGELGDKTQIAAGTGTLVNRQHIRVIFLSSSLALASVAGLTVFFAGLIPPEALPTIVTVGGLLLICYGVWLYRTAGQIEDDSDDNLYRSNTWVLFFSHYSVVFIAELGDKTQVATLAAAVANRSQLLTVFAASVTALVIVTLITVWGATKIPLLWVKPAQKLGSILMVIYGIYMLLSEGPNVILTFGLFYLLILFVVIRSRYIFRYFHYLQVRLEQGEKVWETSQDLAN